MKKFITNKITLTILGIILFFALWSLATVLFDKNSMIFPSPIKTFVALWDILKTPYTYKCLGLSLLKMLIGFIIGCVISFILCIIVRDNEHLYTLISPIMTALKSVPTAAVVFLFVVLVGSSYSPVLLVTLISMPILYESLIGGIHNVDHDLLDSAKVDGSKKTDLFFKLQLPLAIPSLMIGVISSFSLSFKIEIMAEIITGYTRNGLGSLIKSVQVNDPTNMAAIFAYALIAIILMIGLSILGNIIKKKIAVRI